MKWVRLGRNFTKEKAMSSSIGFLRIALLLSAGLLLVTTPPGTTQTASRTTPRLEAVAETRLLMEGLNQTNFRGLQKLLKQEPADDESWRFLRGQALLISETGNLLMLRPPHNAGETIWQERSMELRDTASRLAKAAGSRDYVRSRVGMAELANVCNRCHQTFRVQARMSPAPDATEK